MKKDYYELELDDLVIELENRDSVIEDMENEIIELSEKNKKLEECLIRTNVSLSEYILKDIDEILKK